MRKDKVRSAGQRQIVKGQEPRESGMGAEGLRTMDASLGGASQRIQRDVCVLLNLALWSSLTPAYPISLMRIGFGLFQGLKKFGFSFPASGGRGRGRMVGRKAGGPSQAQLGAATPSPFPP